MQRNIPKGQGSKSGLYKITNLINGNFYVGSTKHLSSRYRTHLSCLKLNKSGCTILQNAVNKYGIDNFEFSVIKVCDNYKEEEILYFEQNFPSYNVVKETRIRREISEETKKKMSVAQMLSYKNGRKKTSLKGRKFNREVKASVKLITDNEELNYNSVEECANVFKCSLQAIYLNFYRGTLFRHKYKVLLINS